MKALFVFTPSEAKRLIAKAVSQLEEVERAIEKGTIVILWGTTTAYVVEEITRREIDKEKYVAGAITNNVLCYLPPEKRLKLTVLRQGKPVEIGLREAVSQMTSGDIVIKGANAVDLMGNAGILLSNEVGGTVGAFIGPVKAKGVELIIPVGLEKLVPSVLEASEHMGIHRVDYSMGSACGYITITGAKVITELEALNILAGVDAYHVASGGTGLSQGSTVILVEGERGKVEKAISIVEKIKGEKPLFIEKGNCETCKLKCIFRGRRKEETPGFLQGEQ